MTFDPFGMAEFHEKVREKIDNGEEGWAQSFIGSVMVSYRRGYGFYAAHSVNPSKNNPFLHDQLNELLLDVARDEGIASARTFSRDYVERLIEGLRMYGSWNKKQHKQAQTLEDYYMNGDGADLLYD